MKKIYLSLLSLGILLSTFYTIRPSNLSFSLSDALIILSFFFGVTTGIIKKLYFGDACKYIYGWILGVFFILAGLLLSDLINQPPLDRTIAGASQYLFTYAIILFVVFPLPSQKDIEKLIFTFVWGLVLVVVIGGFFYVFIPSFYNNLVDKGIFIMKTRFGSFMGPNGMAKTIAVSVPFLLWSIQTKEKKRLSIYIYLLLFGCGLVGAASIGGFISTLLGVITYLMLVTGRKIVQLIKLSMPGFIVILLIVALLATPCGQRLGRPFVRVLLPLEKRSLMDAGSAVSKLVLAQEAVEIIGKSPFFGIGSHQFVEQSAHMEPVHNTYLLLWAEGGILSFIGILLVVLSALIYGFKVYMTGHGNVNRSYGGLLLSTSIVWITNMMTNTNNYARFEVLPMILIIALVSRRELKQRDV